MAAFSNPAAYELYMGRWSKLLAPALVGFAKLPKGARVLDVGSGTGALSLAVLEGVEGSTVVGIEPAETFVQYSREKIGNDRGRFEVGDALNIAFNDDSFDGTASLLIYRTPQRRCVRCRGLHDPAGPLSPASGTSPAACRCSGCFGTPSVRSCQAKPPARRPRGPWRWTIQMA